MKRLVALAALTVAACAGPRPSASPSPASPNLEEIRRVFELAPVYAKYTDVDGFPIVATAQTSDYALAEARFLVGRMLEHRPELVRALVSQRVHLTIMASTEMTTDLPEWANDEPKVFWNRRARGVGANATTRAVSTGEENLLGFSGDPYAGENILIHELAHTVHTHALRAVDPTFDGRLRAAFEHARAERSWLGAYAGTNAEEYWAEGSQTWFEANRPTVTENIEPQTRAALRTYDPALARLLAEVYGEDAWRYRVPAARPPSERAHLAGFDVKRFPRFVWPARAEMPRIPWHERSDLPASRDGAPVWVFIVNRFRFPIELVWIDEQGHEVPRGSILPGGERLEDTKIGHVFLVKLTEGGRTVGFVIPETPSIFIAE